jgi:hypothetical protein
MAVVPLCRQQITFRGGSRHQARPSEQSQGLKAPPYPLVNRKYESSYCNQIQASKKSIHKAWEAQAGDQPSKDGEQNQG